MPYVTVGEALFDLPPVSFSDDIPPAYTAQPRTNFQKYLRKGSKALTMHIARPLSVQSAAVAKHVIEGQGLRSVPHEALPDRFKKMRTISTGELRKVELDLTRLHGHI